MKKIILLFLAIIISVCSVSSAFAARIASQHSKFDYAPVAKQNWRTVHEDKECIVKVNTDAVTDAVYGVTIDGYMPGVIQLKTVLKHGSEIKNPATGKWQKYDARVQRYLVAKKDGNYVYAMACISFYNKDKFLGDDDYPENYKDLSKYERNKNFDSTAEELYGNARLPIIR